MVIDKFFNKYLFILVNEESQRNSNLSSNKNKEIKKRRVEINDKRRKILEMEKSPHIKVFKITNKKFFYLKNQVDITKVKSKIDCRGDSKTNTLQEMNNLNPNKFKRVNDFASEEVKIKFDSQNTQKINVESNSFTNNLIKLNNVTNDITKKDSLIQNPNRDKRQTDFSCLKDLEYQINKINKFSSIDFNLR